MRMPPGLRSAQVHLERRRVHRHQDVELVAGRVDALAAELELEARDAEERAGGARISAGKFGSVASVVAGPGRLGGELLAGELHAVAGVPGETTARSRMRLGLAGSARWPWFRSWTFSLLAW